jgi:iron-sulfur cluster insertion protein
MRAFVPSVKGLIYRPVSLAAFRRTFHAAARAQAQAQAPAEDLVITAAASRRFGDVRAAHAKRFGDESAGRLALRVRVDSGGCSGFKYTIELDPSGPTPDDAVFQKDGATVLVDRSSMPMIAGATLNWTESMARQAFAIINNPNSDSGCSCGASFSPK